MIDRNKFYFVTICCYFSLCEAAAHALSLQQQHHHQQQQQQQSIKDDAIKHQQDAAVVVESPRSFNPRMDYNNEWRPVGRGDPLQNDPTYDYSPPALERVRYWAAEKGDKDANKEGGTGAATSASGSAGKTAAASNKNEILLLGVANERMRPAMTPAHALKNAKGEVPLLQPKYSSIRRSYYAHQLPTHLMPPPPMQSITGSGGSGTHNMMKSSANAVDYRHSMPSPSFTNAGSTLSAMSGAGSMKHTKPYYNTAATSPWTHMHSAMQSHSTAPSTATTMTMQHVGHNSPFSAFDSHQQESAHYLSYTRLGMSHAAETYSPNAIRPSLHATKIGSAAPQRKPWLHELLQKELIKPVRPTMPSTKYLMGPATKPSYDVVSPYAVGITTTHKPINYVTTSTANLPVRKTTLPPMSYTSSPVYITSTALPTTTTKTTTTTTPSPFYQAATRFLIPETSNLAFRPTVAPMEMTTDSLFSHYNQPEKPLMGPMYLIIEGHSKVKTYGKDELDPHRPKIVPIIPKREPIVRIADPNEQRGSVATFQVKHLHTVTTPVTTTTTRKPTTTIPATKATTTTTKTTTTPNSTTMKTSNRPTTTTTTTTTRPTMKTTMRQTTTASLTTPNSRSAPISLKLTTGAGLKTTNQTPSTTLTNIQDVPTQPPTGMQGLLSLLDASFGSFFDDEPTGMDTELAKQQQQQEQQVVQHPQLEPRIGTKGDYISAYREDDKGSDDTGVTTEPVPREVRHIYDYDQLSDSRLKQLLRRNYDNDDTNDEIEEYEDSVEDSIKRYDKVMDYVEEDNVENAGYDNEEAEEDEEIEEDVDEDDVERNVRVAPVEKA